MQKNDDGALSLALGAFQFRSSTNRGNFLFVTGEHDEVDFWASVQKLTLDETRYAALRDAVIAKARAT